MGPTGRTVVPILVLISSACGDNRRTPEPEPERVAEPARNPIRQGFTGEPPAAAVELPPPPPLLSEEELEAARKKTPTAEEREAAQRELRRLLAEFGERPERRAVERIRAVAIQHARQGRLHLTSAFDLYKEYEFPNEPARADAKYKNQVIVLTGTVLPHNVAEIADIYKIFEREPYVQDPLLLKTGFDVTFVRCQLAQPSLQKLSDWQPIQLAGIVQGKVGSDVVLDQCVVFY